MDMKYFLPGDRVICTADHSEHHSKEGVLTQEWCEYGDHVWGVNFDDGSYAELRYDYLEYVEDPYEYAIQRVSKDGQEEARIIGSFWNDRKEVNQSLLNLTSETVEYKLVKRRRAGEVVIEDV